MEANNSRCKTEGEGKKDFNNKEAVRKWTFQDSLCSKMWCNKISKGRLNLKEVGEEWEESPVEELNKMLEDEDNNLKEEEVVSRLWISITKALKELVVE